jgi:chitinase
VQRPKLGLYALVAGAVVAAVTTIITTTPHDAPQANRPIASLGPVSYSDARLSDNWYGAAPYAMPADRDAPDLAQVMAATGQRSFTLGPVRAPTGGGCRATWGGDQPVSADTTVRDAVVTVRNLGGDVVLSFGGYGGTKLGQVCANAEATADAYQEAINKYSARAVDFDIEPPGLGSPTAVANEVRAAQILQQRNDGLHVSITTAGSRSGTGRFGQQVLDQAKSIGFAPDNYSISTVDGGLDDAGSMIGALEAFHGMLMNTFGLDAATAYAREGFVGVNGESQPSVFFDQDAFRAVLDYAIGHKLGRYTFMSVNRDRPCGASDDAGACSNVPQAPWEFTRFTARFGTATEPTAPAPPPAMSTTDTTTTAPPPPPPAPPPATTTAPPPAPAPPGPSTLAILRAGLSYEAESPDNMVLGNAVVFSCDPCSGQHKVGRLGSDNGALVFNDVTVDQAGTYALRIDYVDADSGRSALVTVNGRSAWLRFSGTGDDDWNHVQTLTVAVPLNAGQNTIAFSNPNDCAPDIDRISL